MIILKTNVEMKSTFERLIKTMKEPVEWDGKFVAVGDYLILHGRLRSLFFNFENKRVFTNIIEIPLDESSVVEIGDNAKARNVLNLVLYAFGKWGLIRGVKVDQDFAQLNALFAGVLREFAVEPGYTLENFRFYKQGIRIAYEDVVQFALEATEDSVEGSLPEDENGAVLWHKLVWKQQKKSFSKMETTFDQRQKNRLGNNFYMVSYQCPSCQGHLHMVVFPVGKEFRIETTEGGVFLARAYTCSRCNCLYTPRPEELLEEGNVYVMDFDNDSRAYEDYLELLGMAGERVSNYKFNEFEAVRKRNEQLKAEENESLEELCGHMEQLSDAKVAKVAAKMEEGFYPMGSVERFEETVHQVARERQMQKERAVRGASFEAAVDRAHQKRAKQHGSGSGILMEEVQKAANSARAYTDPARKAPDRTSVPAAKPQEALVRREISAARREAAKKRYIAKCSVLDRLSPAQVTGLKNELLKDPNLYDAEKKPFLTEVIKKENEQKMAYIKKLAAGCPGQSYTKIRRIVTEIEKIELPREEKSEVLEPLYAEQNKQGKEEVTALLQKMPKQLDMKQYQTYVEKLQGYSQVDLSPYQEFLQAKRRQAQNYEIAHQIRHTRMNNRQDLTNLLEKIKGGNFDQEIASPYLQKIEDKIREYDENAIEEICGNPAQMTAADTMEAYQKIEEGVFLPELKADALEMLKKRLYKLKTDECELLVNKFENSLVGRIQVNDRHHFYPAHRIMTKEAKPEEYQVITYALETYGTERGMFEYPILVVDTSKDMSGKEGMILTPEQLFYRTMLSAYVVPVGDIRGIQAQTGMFKSGLYMELRNGTKVKLPCAVERREMVAWGNCLEEFVRYLQDKPDSRQVSYLAKEKHETICCFRCGYSYKGGNVCPKCGYKMNQ